MPVFTAFGWAGEEAAITFALTQLEEFVQRLQYNLPAPLREELKVAGVSRANQAAYLAAAEDVESDIHISFFARPMSLEIQLALTNRKVLAAGLSRAEKSPDESHKVLAQLDPSWTFRVQQMQVEQTEGEEEPTLSHYQDLFKDSVSAWDLETAVSVLGKANYLNSQEQWVTPIYLSYRLPSEQVAAMGMQVIEVMHDQIVAIMPALYFFSGRTVKTEKKVRPKSRAISPSADPLRRAATAHAPLVDDDAEPDEEFTYQAVLKPLHIRRGFINMTPEHWPFFADSARATTRKVTVFYGGKTDKESSVWRLQPHDQARLVLSSLVRDWLDTNFADNDNIELRAQKIDDEIQISLAAPH
ncbi:MAG: hypothetical protein R6X32_19515 [Chloroflexota bacterium]